MSRADTGIIGSEWVHTGPVFARTHPMSLRLGAVWLIVGWVAPQLVSALMVMVHLLRVAFAGRVLFALLLLVLVLNNLLAVFGLLTRNTVALYPVWVSLILGALLTFPLMICWGSGLRPNLIYRHRFGRQVWPDKARLA